MSEQLTPEVVVRLKQVSGGYGWTLPNYTLVLTHLPALIAAAEREKAREQCKFLNIGEAERIVQLEKRVAELEKEQEDHHVDAVTRALEIIRDAGIDVTDCDGDGGAAHTLGCWARNRMRDYLERIAELEALLDRVPHDQDRERHCFASCIACEWREIKGNTK